MLRNEPVLSVRDLTFGYRIAHPVCRNLNVDVSANQVIGIMGPSGCGKSTLLRLISGFLRQQSGSIEISGKDISEWSPQLRPTSMVFQNSALFPYLSVYDNLTFGLRIRGVPSAQIRQTVDNLLDMLELAPFKDFRARDLSGGQKQRVAIGRSLAIEPKVLLLDEPLSSIDERLRDDLRLFIKQVLKTKELSAILVSHTFQDTASICDKVIFWQDQKLTLPQRVEDWVRSPMKVSIAEMMGYKNIVSTDWLRVIVNSPHQSNGLPVHSSHVVIPEDSIDISLNKEKLNRPSEFILNGIVKSLRWRTTKQYAVVDVQGVMLETEVRSLLTEGITVALMVDPTKLMCVDE